MLAIAHPVQHNPSVDSPHRSASSSSRPARLRKPNTAAAASSLTPFSSASSSRLPSVASLPQTRRLTAPILPTTPAAFVAKQTRINAPASEHHPIVPPPSPSLKALKAPASEVPVLDIHSYPAHELLRLLASLLTQIAATNDKLSTTSQTQSDLPSPSASPDHHSPIWNTLTSASRTALSTPSSTLTFHARNIPTISLEAYFLRILKYCPTTNEVFLSLLVYFDRMSKMSTEATGKTFVIDSYNIHRLVIAGVTVASKFFSDVFYTNSRYAKVRTELMALSL